jgi:SAM-dependent methyltransferase
MTDSLQRTYDLVAGDYVAHVFDELKDKPFDRGLLDEIVARAGDGVICDLGCGPGHVARYLHERGAQVVGIDLSPGMIERARALTPGVRFEAGDMRALDVADGTFQAVVAMYSIIHIAPEALAEAFGEMRRVLAPGGTLVVSFHIGSEIFHRDEWWGHAVDVDFHFLQPAQVTTAMEAAGLTVERSQEREPYPEVEYPSRRAYVTAANC